MANPNHLKAFDDRLDALLAGGPEDRASFVHGHEQITRLRGVSAKANAMAADVATGKLDRLRSSAADARVRARLDARKVHPAGGRPPKPVEQAVLDQFESELADSQDDAAAAVRELDATVGRLIAAWDRAENLGELAARERAAVGIMMSRLAETVKAADAAFGLLDEWQRTVSEIGDVGVLPSRKIVDPFPGGGREILNDLYRDLRENFDSETARIDRETAHGAGELTADETSAVTAAEFMLYQSKLRAAGADYAKTPQGRKDKASLQNIYEVVSEKLQLEKPAETTTERAVAAQAMKSWWTAVCRFGNLEEKPGWYPLT